MGSSDGVDVTSQVQVKVFHRNGLAVTASGSTACASIIISVLSTFDTKSGTLARLPHTPEYLTTNVAKSLGEAHGCGRFALTKRSRSDSCNHYIISIFLILQSVKHS